MKWSQLYAVLLAYVENYLAAMLSYILVLKMASNWKSVMKNWHQMDCIFEKYCNEIRLSKLSRAGIFLVVAMILGKEFSFLSASLPFILFTLPFKEFFIRECFS